MEGRKDGKKLGGDGRSFRSGNALATVDAIENSWETDDEGFSAALSEGSDG